MKVKLFPCTIRKRTENGGVTPHIPTLGTRLVVIVRFTHRPFTRWQRVTGILSIGAGVIYFEEDKAFFFYTGKRAKTPRSTSP
jgi:hypothetical protein